MDYDTNKDLSHWLAVKTKAEESITRFRRLLSSASDRDQTEEYQYMIDAYQYSLAWADSEINRLTYQGVRF